jgi:enoyl-CoA hydratase/carnithine racemase
MGTVIRGGAAPWRAPAKVLDFSLAHRDGAVVVHCRSAISTWDAAALGAFRNLLQSLEDGAAQAAVILCGEQAFKDPERFDAAGRVAQPDLLELTTSLAQATKPVIAALSGEASGAGLEVALACAQRIAGPRASISAREARLGLMPINGGLERLASLAGLRTALDLFGFGRGLGAEEALRTGAFDRVVSGDIVEDILGRLEETRGDRPPSKLPKTSEDLGCELLDLAKSVRAFAPGQQTPKAVLQALEFACQVNLHRSVREVRRVNSALAASPQSKALQYAAAIDLACASEARDEETWSPLQWSLTREAIHLVDEGAAPLQVDRALMAFGFSRPLFLEVDAAGLSALAAHACKADAWVVYSPTVDLLVEAGRLGRAAGAGWYRHAKGGETPVEDRTLVTLLEESAMAQRLRRRPIEDQEILTRCLAALLMEAARLIEDGQAKDAAQIDWLCNRLGFPRWRGGLLYALGCGSLPDLAPSWRASGRGRNTLGAPGEIVQGWVRGAEAQPLYTKSA